MSMKKVFEVAMLLTAKDEATKKILEASKAQQAAIKSMSGYGDKAFGVGVGAGAIGVGISAGIGVTIKAAEESEIAYNKMNLALKLGGDLQEKRAKAAAQYANNLQFQIGIEDEEIEMTQTKLASFHKLTTAGADVKNVFDRATKAAYDMAAGGFGDAIGNANILGKALQNPAAMATALAKSGSLDKGLDIPLIKRIQASKGLVAAQDYILKAVEKQYKGQSEAAATATSKMRVKWAEVSETLGKTLLPQFMKLMTAIGNVADRFQGWASKNPELLSTIMKLAVGTAAFAFAVSGTAFALGGVFKVISAVMWIGGVYKNFMMLMKAAQMAYTFTLLASGSGFQAVSAGLKAMNLGFLTSPIFWGIALLVGIVFLIIKYWEPIKTFFANLWEGIKTVFNSGVDFFKKWIGILSKKIDEIMNSWDKIKAFFVNLWTGVKVIFFKALEFYLWLPKKFLSIGSDIVMGLWNGIKSKAAALFDFVKSVGSGIAKAFKTVLGINSPSKVFMDYGVNITEGAHNGIKKGQSNLVGASSGMGKSLIPSGGGGRSGGGSAITVNFSPVINGGSGDIASQVKALIPELIRQIESKMQRKQALSY